MKDSTQEKYTSSTRRIAKNTLMLYFRQILIMLVSLYTVRVVLNTLGAEDYGIYNVVAGVVTMFSFISGSISIAIARFITIEVGNKNKGKVREIFATSIIIQISISIIVVILCEFLGTWFIFNKMNIPAGRLSASFWIMQFSLLTFVLNLLSIPYNAVIIAHEKMSVFAYISIFESALKLSTAYLLQFIPSDKLIMYGVLQFIISLILRLTYGIYCKHNFQDECRFSFFFSKKLLGDMYKFIGWAFLGNGIIIIKDYGVNILINIYCGSITNAARGIAGQVNTAAVSFTSNFMMAINPQITKSYAEKKLSYVHSLIIQGQKFSFLILFFLLVILVPNIGFILTFWLKEVPPHTANLVILILLYSLTETYVNPLVTGVLAEGNIRNFEISLVIIYLFNFFVSYLLLQNGYAVEKVFIFNILFKLFVCVSLLIHSHQKYGFPIKNFIKDCVLPTLCVLVFCAGIIYLFHSYDANSFKSFVLYTLINCGVSIPIITFIGLNGKERKFIFRIIKDKIRLGRSTS